MPWRIEARNIGLRPILSESQPDSGVMIAGGDDCSWSSTQLYLVLAALSSPCMCGSANVGDGRIQRVHQRGQHQGPGDRDIGCRCRPVKPLPRRTHPPGLMGATLCGVWGWSHQSKFGRCSPSPCGEGSG